ncbi:MAG: NAD-dependent deacetylase [Deltaproteobacteria bacterium]|nr:NAD-dependent deacetylase [Deltaproteobacteria bacterium]
MDLDEFAARLRRATDIVFFTGAGISTESGIPDFRSPGGKWSRMRPVYYDEFVSSEEARVQAWQRKKESYQLYKDVTPNIGHTSIGDLEKRGKLLGLITQNIDGLHSRGGVSDEKIVELHGSDRTVVCLGCGKLFDPDEVLASLGETFTSPRCDACDGLLKTGTISFGQAMPQAAMSQAQIWSEAAEIFIVVGSSLVVQPAASFPVIAKQAGALLAIVNREPTHIEPLADYSHQGEIGEFFRTLNPLLADA